MSPVTGRRKWLLWMLRLWFGQPFKNLNTEVANYPYVDLISEDQELFVQVSTVQDISGKIKSTLENIRDTKDSRFSRVKNIVFFMLHNQSVDRVSDFTGDAQIGNIPFMRNLFAFEVQIHFVPSGDPKLDFYPIGNGRPALIQLIYKYGLFKNAKTERTQIVKLCQDYAKQRDGKKDAAPSACAIATYYVDEILKECNSNNYYHLIQGMSPCLTIIYQMPTAAEDWLKSFLNQLSDFYRSDDPGRGRVAEDTIQWTMKNAYPQLVSAFPKELCALFEVFWTKPTDTRETFYQHRLEDGQRYGLNEHTENYSHKFRTVESNPFLWNL